MSISTSCCNYGVVDYGSNIDFVIIIVYVQISAVEVLGHIESVKILVILNPTGYMLTSSGFAAFI